MANITLLWSHPTRKGPVFIGQTPDGRFHPVWKGESLGSYHSAIAAIDDVAGGHTFEPPDGTDLGALGISADPGDWVHASELMQSVRQPANHAACSWDSAIRRVCPSCVSTAMAIRPVAVHTGRTQRTTAS